MDQLRKKELGDDEACDMDEDFIKRFRSRFTSYRWSWNRYR